MRITCVLVRESRGWWVGDNVLLRVSSCLCEYWRMVWCYWLAFCRTPRNQIQETAISVQFVPRMRFLVFEFGVQGTDIAYGAAGILEEGARGGLLLEGGGGIIIAGATVCSYARLLAAHVYHGD
eukprot:2204626-Rhodomonas_salina.1